MQTSMSNTVDQYESSNVDLVPLTRETNSFSPIRQFKHSITTETMETKQVVMLCCLSMNVIREIFSPLRKVHKQEGPCTTKSAT